MYYNGNIKRFTKLGIAYAILLVIIAGYSGYLIYEQHKNDFKSNSTSFKIPKLPKLTAAQQATLYHIEGRPLPSLGNGYDLIFQTPADATQQPPEQDYITSEAKVSTEALAETICSHYDFTTRKLNTGYDLVNATVNYPVYIVQCYDANNSWSFDIESAAALASAEYTGTGSFQYSNMINGQVSPKVLNGPLASEWWVNVRSLGTPVVKCNDNSVCYVDKSSLVKSS